MKTSNAVNIRDFFDGLTISWAMIKSKQFSPYTMILLSYFYWHCGHSKSNIILQNTLDKILKEINYDSETATATLFELNRKKFIKWTPNVSVEVL